MNMSLALELFLKRYPLQNEAEFKRFFPDDQALAAVKEILDEALRLPPTSAAMSLTEISALVRDGMRARRPELSNAALHKLGSYVSYQMR